VDGKNPLMGGAIFSFCLWDFGGKMDLEIAVAVLGRIGG